MSRHLGPVKSQLISIGINMLDGQHWASYADDVQVHDAHSNRHARSVSKDGPYLVSLKTDEKGFSWDGSERRTRRKTASMTFS